MIRVTNLSDSIKEMKRKRKMRKKKRTMMRRRMMMRKRRILTWLQTLTETMPG